MTLRNEARYLRSKALASMRSAMTAFNGLDEDGRATRVRPHRQLAFEMLLKAALVAIRGTFDIPTTPTPRMKEAIDNGVDLDATWASHGAVRGKGPCPECAHDGCKAKSVAS